MAYKKKTWHEKMHPYQKPVVKVNDKAFADIPAGAKMLIATPQIVDGYIKHIPEGTSTTLQQMRKDLAAEYGAEYTCPVTSGIFLRIVAENAYESYLQGTPISKLTPFWRMIDISSPAAAKLSFGLNLLREQRTKEGLPLKTKPAKK